MTNTLHSPAVRTLLDRLFAEAARDGETLTPPISDTASAEELAEVLSAVYMPISEGGGSLLYSLARATRPETIVEFGTSYGISTIYLAAAVADNGTGHVFSTELSATKIAAAERNLKEAGLAGHVTILPGNALETLADIPGPIGLALLDGWKDLCLPVLRLLEPQLAPGALVIGDDNSFPTMADYVSYVREPANGYVSTDFPVQDGMELSCRA
jgi:predicted O-methyltransferase YrrM